MCMLQNSEHPWCHSCSEKSRPDKSASNINLRLEVLVQENVISVKLKAVFVIDDDLLDTLEAAHKYIVDVLKEPPDPLSAVLGGEVSPELLHRPLAYLWRNTEQMGVFKCISEPTAQKRRGFLNNAPIRGHNLGRFSE